MYVTGGDTVIEKEAERICSYALSNKHLSEIKGHVLRRSFHNLDDFDSNVNIINLQNGLYSIKDNRLVVHTPQYLSLNQKPIEYDPEARPKLFWKFLIDVLYPQEIRTAVEAMAYTFYRDCPFEYFFRLYGYGSNGKSVYTGGTLRNCMVQEH